MMNSESAYYLEIECALTSCYVLRRVHPPDIILNLWTCQRLFRLGAAQDGVFTFHYQAHGLGRGTKCAAFVVIRCIFRG